MKSKTLKTAFTFMLSGILATAISAQPPAKRGYGPGYGWNNNDQREARIEILLPDLTEDQKSSLEELRIERYKTAKEHRNQMGELSAQQRTIMSENPIDEKAAQKIIDERAELLKKQMTARVAHQAALQEILTEEQYMKLEQVRHRRQFAQHRLRPGRGGNYQDNFQGNRQGCRQGYYR